MMKTNRNILLNKDRQPRCRIALLAAALYGIVLLAVGCTAGGDILTPNDEDNDLVEITPTATINGVEANATRAATDNNETFYFKRSEETGVGTGVFDSYTGLFKATRAASTGAGALTFETPQYYFTDGRKCRYVGYYPMYTGIGVDLVSWDINGTMDVMTATRREGSKTDKGITTFDFKHRLTQLQFFPFCETADVAGQWGKITKIEVLALKTHVMWQYAEDGTGNLTTNATTTDLTVSGITDATPFTPPTGGKASATLQAGGPCMIFPQTAASYVLTVRITTEKLGVKTVTRTGVLLENTPYRIYLRLAGQAIEIAAVENMGLEDWQTGTEQGGSLSTTYPYVIEGNTIVSKDANGQGATEIHPNLTTTPWHDEWNAPGYQVAAKFMVADANISEGIDHDTAFTLCQAPWRMPTFAELKVMWEMRERLTLYFPIGVYWAASRWHNTPQNYRTWVNWSDGSFTSGSLQSSWHKSKPYKVRCIKDIE